jgi:hypothetical protein
VRAHSGWALALVVGGTLDEPLVLGRRRLTLAAVDDEVNTQPYHAAASLGVARGRAIVERCAARAEELALEGLRRLADEFAPHRLVSCAILTSKPKVTLDLETTLRSHALIHGAEGLLFREAVARAAVACGLELHPVQESEALALAAAAWHCKPASVEKRLTDLRRSAGAPWTRDEKLATIAGLLALREPGVSRKHRRVRVHSNKSLLA